MQMQIELRKYPQALHIPANNLENATKYWIWPEDIYEALLFANPFTGSLGLAVILSKFYRNECL